VALDTATPDLANFGGRLWGGDGLDFVRSHRDRRSRAHWLFLSAIDQLHPVHEAAALGVRGFLMKNLSGLGVFPKAVRTPQAGGAYFRLRSA
jgi:DNA-binding NarL/FixJ family response regulator